MTLVEATVEPQCPGDQPDAHHEREQQEPGQRAGQRGDGAALEADGTDRALLVRDEG